MRKIEKSKVIEVMVKSAQVLICMRAHPYYQNLRLVYSCTDTSWHDDKPLTPSGTDKQVF
jgi:hypothetical protein